MVERVSELRTSALKALEDACGSFEVVPVDYDAGLVDCAALVVATRLHGSGNGAWADRADVSAALKALEALGYPRAAVAVVVIDNLPASGFDEYELRVVLETVDPEAILIVDSPAARATWSCFGVRIGGEGEIAEVSGRRVLFVGEFAEMLSDADRKREAWERIKLLAPQRTVY